MIKVTELFFSPVLIQTQSETEAERKVEELTTQAYELEGKIYTPLVRLDNEFTITFSFTDLENQQIWKKRVGLNKK